MALGAGLSTVTTADPILPTQLADAPTGLASTSTMAERQPVALADGAPPPPANTNTGGTGAGASGSGGNLTDEDALQARLDALRRG